jgi:hypothetical protein
MNKREQDMKIVVRMCRSIIIAAILFMPALAGGSDTTTMPWDHFSISLGGFSTALNSSLVFGTDMLGLGVDINPEEAFGLDTSVFAFRADGEWRFTQNRRHGADFSYIDLRRSSEKVVAQDIPIFDTTILEGTLVQSSLDIQIIKLGYSYSFFQDDRFDLGASIGLFLMPISFSLSGDQIGDKETQITAPLPVVGLRFDFALTPKLFIKQDYNLFYLAINDFKGVVVNSKIALEYNAWKHVGLGIGVESFRLHLEDKGGNDYPGIDFIGKLEFRYAGLLLYGKVYFN